jgi:hypothetical protein
MSLLLAGIKVADSALVHDAIELARSSFYDSDVVKSKSVFSFPRFFARTPDRSRTGLFFFPFFVLSLSLTGGGATICRRA